MLDDMTFAEKTARNARVQARYDELMREGKHGHYETMFRVVHEECDRAISESAPLSGGGDNESGGRDHFLKTWPQYFERIIDGSKPFEIRENDRDFQTGDNLILQEWDPSTAEYTGRVTRRRVAYLMRGGAFGIAPNYVVMGLPPPPVSEGEIPGGNARPRVPGDGVNCAGTAVPARSTGTWRDVPATTGDLYDVAEDVGFGYWRLEAIKQRALQRAAQAKCTPSKAGGR